MAQTRNHTGHSCGASHHKAKLSSEQVAKIREKHESGAYSYETLAKLFNCGVSTVRDIVLYRTRWAG